MLASRNIFGKYRRTCELTENKYRDVPTYLSRHQKDMKKIYISPGPNKIIGIYFYFAEPRKSGLAAGSSDSNASNLQMIINE